MTDDNIESGEPVTAGMITRNDIRVAEAEFRFEDWSWGSHTSIDEISEDAAEVVMRVLVAQAALEVTVTDGHAQLEFATFDYEFRLERPLLSAVDYWLETRADRTGSVGPIDQPEYQETAIILADLEEACRRLRTALDKSQADA